MIFYAIEESHPSAVTYDLAVIFNKNNLYNQINTNKILVDISGRIVQENFFNRKSLNNLEQLKYLVFRSFMIKKSCKKAKYNFNNFKKQRSHLDSINSTDILEVKYRIIHTSDEKLLIDFLNKNQKECFNLFLQSIVYYKGERFLRLYIEAIEFIYNFTSSLFKSYLYHNFKPYKHYDIILESYIYFFCSKLITQYGIENTDIDSDYNLNSKYIKLICKLFNEKLVYLHKHSKGDINLIIENELNQINKIEKFGIL